MATWAQVTRAAPELAAAVQARFEAYGLGLLATIRRDGSPRITGLEPLFTTQDLWLGMMLNSRKARDLLRDPRFALHNATIDKQVTEGDGRVSGLAVLVEGAEAEARFRAAFLAHTGTDIPPEPMHLFRAEVREIAMIRPSGDHLLIDWWREGDPAPRHRDRY